MTDLSISNIVNISLSATPRGAGAFSLSNIALISVDQPLTPFSTGYKTYLNPTEVGTDFGTSSTTFTLVNDMFSQSPSFLSGGGYLVIIPRLTTPTLEGLPEAITRSNALINYFGILSTKVEADATTLVAAAIVQPLRKMLFVGSKVATAFTTGGIAGQVTSASYYKTRILGRLVDTVTDLAVVRFCAAYASRLLSTVFSGNNTTSTMHMKDMIGITADTGMSDSILVNAKAQGVDTYPSFFGIPKVFSTKGNQFADNVYNREWLLATLELSGFNFLSTLPTKLPQTEKGMDAFKGAYELVLRAGVTNAYIAPGEWTLPTTFGDPEIFRTNIRTKGYYVYSAPISSQSSTDRSDRKAPVVQIAYKLAGAVHSGDVLVYINE